MQAFILPAQPASAAPGDRYLDRQLFYIPFQSPEKRPRLATGPLICELDIYESRSSQRTIFTNWIFMRRTPASEQYLHAQITLLLFTVYTILLCASIESASRFQKALQDRGDLRSCCVALWPQFIVRHARDQTLCHCPAHGICGPCAWLGSVC